MNRNILKNKKANCIGYMLSRNCLPKHVIEGKIESRIEVMGRRGRRRMQLLDDLNKSTGYGKLKEEAPYCTLWRIRCVRSYGQVVRQTIERTRNFFFKLKMVLSVSVMLKLGYKI